VERTQSHGVTGVLRDISGNLRHVTSPAIGAFELPAITVPGDIDGDGQVSTLDLLILVGIYGCVGDDCQGDIDGDGVVTVMDLIILISSME